MNKRKKIAEFYKKELKDFPVNFQLISKRYESSYHLLVIKINKGKKLKKKIFDILRKNKIFVNVNYIPIHLQP